MNPTPWLSERHGYDPPCASAIRHGHGKSGSRSEAVLGRQHLKPTPWLTERDGKDNTSNDYEVISAW